MPDFTVDLRDSDSQYLQQDPLLNMRPIRWSSRARGGFYRARVAVTGARDGFQSLPRHIGNAVSIHSELGQEVWSGYVHEIEIWDGGQRVIFSLDNVINRVATAYTVFLADGSEQRQTTDWVSDLRSIERFGLRELLITTQATTESAAEALRDQILSQYAQPEPQFEFEDSEEGIGAMLYCYGNAERLNNVNYANAKGLVENSESRRGEIALGAYYTATTITFSEPGEIDDDDVYDSANGLGNFTEGQTFYSSGSALGNVGSFTVVNLANAGHLEVSSRDLVYEAAGNSITLARDEDRASRLAQSFEVDTSWAAYTVALRVRKVGSPADNIQARLYSDSGGEPDALLAFGAIAAADVPTDDAWVEIDFGTPYTLAAATTYHLDIIRTGAVDFGDYYVISVDENLSYTDGSLQIVKDGSWDTRSTDADLLFRITGREDTVDQIENILLDQSLFDAVVLGFDATSIETWQYRGGDRTAWSELEALLDIGDSAGNRIEFVVVGDNIARVYKRPAAAATDPVLMANGQLNGIDPGHMVAGRWIKIGNPLMSTMLGAREVYVDHSEYDAKANSMKIMTETSPDAESALLGEL